MFPLRSRFRMIIDNMEGKGPEEKPVTDKRDGSDKSSSFSARYLPNIFMLHFFMAILLGVITYQVIDRQKSIVCELEKKNRIQQAKITYLTSQIKKIDNDLEELGNFHDLITRQGRFRAEGARISRLSISDKKGHLHGKTPTGDNTGGNDPAQYGMGGPYLEESSTGGGDKRGIDPLEQALKNIEQNIATVRNSENELFEFIQAQKECLARIPTKWPVKGHLSSPFGYRISPFTGKREFHRGIDISTGYGTKIKAPADGIVTRISRCRGYGLNITIRHGYGIETRYAHLQKVFVKKGQFIRRGEVIALSGNSGRSTGPHLHYEIHVNGYAMNPLRFITN